MIGETWALTMRSTPPRVAVLTRNDGKDPWCSQAGGICTLFSSEHWISCHPVLKPGRSKNETSSPSSQSDATSKSGSSACAARPRRTNLQGAKQNYMDYCMVMYQDEVPFYPFKWPLTTKKGHLILRHPHISLDIVIYKKYHLWSFGHNMELNKIQHKLTTVSRTLPVW